MISVIVPTYNEKDNISNLIKEILGCVDAEIIVVDDNSPDGTAALVENLAKHNKNIRLIRRAGKLGLGSAIVEGFEFAKGDIIGVMDADFSHPPALIKEMVKELNKGADIVLGSRYVKGGRIENWPLKRKLASRIAVLLASLLTKAKDPVTGFFFVRKKIFDDIKIKSGETKSWKVSLEILVRGNYKKLAEVPYTFVNRKRGKSKISANEYKTYMRQILGLLLYRIMKKR